MLLAPGRSGCPPNAPASELGVSAGVLDPSVASVDEPVFRPPVWLPDWAPERLEVSADELGASAVSDRKLASAE